MKGAPHSGRGYSGRRSLGHRKPLRPDQHLASKNIVMRCQVRVEDGVTVHVLSPKTGLTTEVPMKRLPEELRTKILKEEGGELGVPFVMGFTTFELKKLFEASRNK